MEKLIKEEPENIFAPVREQLKEEWWNNLPLATRGRLILSKWEKPTKKKSRTAKN